LKTAK